MRRAAFVWCSLLPLLGGCAATGPSGRWVGDREAARAFEKHQIFPGHQYYYVGSRWNPDGVIAIDPRFRLKEGKVWAAVNADEATLAEWQGWWRIGAFRHCMYQGGLIIAPSGERAGYWYSPFLLNCVYMNAEGELVVHQPHSPTGATSCEGTGGGEDREILWGR